MPRFCYCRSTYRNPQCNSRILTSIFLEIIVIPSPLCQAQRLQVSEWTFPNLPLNSLVCDFSGVNGASLQSCPTTICSAPRHSERTRFSSCASRKPATIHTLSSGTLLIFFSDQSILQQLQFITCERSPQSVPTAHTLNNFSC